MDTTAFAKTWEEGWNSHNLDLIMAHYREDIAFRSAKALTLVGQGEILGKPALRAYWAAALVRQPDLHFRVRDVFAGHEMLVISYLNQQDVLAVETLYFDDKAQVFRAAACHRATS